MKDHENLNNHNIKDGLTVHLVIKAPRTTTTQNNQESTASRPARKFISSFDGICLFYKESNVFFLFLADISATPFGLGNMGGLLGLENSFGLGQTNFAELQQRMQRELLTNSDSLRQVFDSPLVQSLMSDPESMRSLLMANPQMQELMQRNPEISHMLNNPDLLR